ncbi:MAG: hypothetical protein EHM90_00070 [Chloroflexi bacterium]|nr:MAG: hypothetical protein EHM90_06195 [Chloroflexota bacterium]RPH37172.1 MAG: hypothetical protein EHM90_00070 [Chloroflexota bacterium]
MAMVPENRAPVAVNPDAVIPFGLAVASDGLPVMADTTTTGAAPNRDAGNVTEIVAGVPGPAGAGMVAVPDANATPTAWAQSERIGAPGTGIGATMSYLQTASAWSHIH